MIVKGVRCDRCSTVHEVDKPTYFTVIGNICVMENGGIVGNNIIAKSDDSIESIRSSHYCLKCLINILNEVINEK